MYLILALEFGDLKPVPSISLSLNLYFLAVLTYSFICAGK
jgi:hypothetical protein